MTASEQRASEPTRLPPTPTRRGLFSRLSAGHIVMIVAALLAAIVNLNLLQERDETFLVTVAATDILPGQTVGAGDFRAEEIRAGGDLLERLVMFEQAAGLEGRIAIRSISAGSLVSNEDFQSAAAPLRRRAMSIPVDEELAVGGAITTADVVDVIAVDEGIARYVVVGAPVLATPGADSGGFGATGRYFVTIAVDGEVALELASALDTGEVYVVRSTGADAPAIERFDPASLQGDAEGTASSDPDAG